MAALTSSTHREHLSEKARLLALPVKAGAVIYRYALVAVDANNLAVPASDLAGLTFAGVAFRELDNAGKPDGVLPGRSYGEDDGVVEVDTDRVYSFAVTGGTPNFGDDAFAIDDNTVSVASTNNVRVGRFWSPNPERPSEYYVDISR